MDTVMDGGLPLALTGMLVVFTVLALISLLVATFGYLDRRFTTEKTDDKTVKQSPEIDNITLILISAAVTTILRGRHRIHRIRRLDRIGSGWQQSGRAILHASHVIPKKLQK